MSMLQKRTRIDMIWMQPAPALGGACAATDTVV